MYRMFRGASLACPPPAKGIVPSLQPLRFNPSLAMVTSHQAQNAQDVSQATLVTYIPFGPAQPVPTEVQLHLFQGHPKAAQKHKGTGVPHPNPTEGRRGGGWEGGGQLN
jgi:hypothetical protein